MSRLLTSAFACGAIVFGITACGDDVLPDSDKSISVVDSIDPDDCNESSQGSTAFVKSKGTVYICSDGEWVALNAQDAIQYRCSSKELKDKSGYEIICDGETIGTIKNGKDGVAGKDGATGATGATGAKGAKGDKGDTGVAGKNGTNGVNGKDGKDGTNGIDGTNGTNGIDGKDGKDGKDANVDSLAKAISANVLKNVSENLAKQVAEESSKLVTRADSISAAMKESLVKELKDSTTSISKILESTITTLVEEKIAKESGTISDALQSDLNNKTEELQDSLNAKIERLETKITKELSASITETLTTFIEEKIGEEQDALAESLQTSLDNQVKVLKEEISSELEAVLTKNLTASLTEKLACKIDDELTKIDSAKSIIKVAIKCGEGTSYIELPVYLKNANLDKVYQKHVVVRFPVQTEKENSYYETYEEIWTRLTSGNYSELTIMDLDANLEQTGKQFVSDLVASNPKAFATVEVVEPADKTKESIVIKKVNYRVVRLEGDFDITNLENSVVQLRVKLNLSANEKPTDIVYNAIVDLDDEGDIVIDFLTDYKAARVKELVKAGNMLSKASETANAELAAALALSEDAENYPAFETYLPDSIELNEHVNSVIWVMALFNQADNINKVYADYRNVFAKNGNFNTAINETFDGKEQSLFFIDYLALLTNEYFDMMDDCDGEFWDCYYEYNGYKARDEVLYKILQKGFKDAYKLPESNKDEIVMTDTKGGLFKFFEYDKDNKIWTPISANMIREYSDYYASRIVSVVKPTAKCTKESDEDQEITIKFGDEEITLYCKEGSTPSWDIVNIPSSSSSYIPSSSSQMSEEEMIDIMLGKCDRTVMKEAEFKDVDICKMRLATTTCTRQYKCDCDIVDSQYVNCAWTNVSETEIQLNQICNAELVQKKAFSKDDEYICDSTFSRTGKVNDWRQPTDYDYCDRHAKTPTKIYEDENIPEEKQIYAYCTSKYGTTYVKPTKGDEWQNAEEYLGKCNIPSSASSGADILMEGYKEAEYYRCDTNKAGISTWWKSSLEEIMQLGTRWNFQAKSIEIQCRTNYTIPEGGYNGMTYRSYATNGDGAKIDTYASNDKRKWIDTENMEEWCNFDGNYIPLTTNEKIRNDSKLCEYKGVTYYQKYAFNKWYNIEEYCSNRFNITGGKQENLFCGDSGVVSSPECLFDGDFKRSDSTSVYAYDQAKLYVCDEEKRTWVEAKE